MQEMTINEAIRIAYAAADNWYRNTRPTRLNCGNQDTHWLPATLAMQVMNRWNAKSDKGVYEYSAGFSASCPRDIDLKLRIDGKAHFNFHIGCRDRAPTRGQTKGSASSSYDPTTIIETDKALIHLWAQEKGMTPTQAKQDPDLISILRSVAETCG